MTHSFAALPDAEVEFWKTAVRRHRALRVVGMVLFVVAVALFLAHVPLVFDGRMAWYRIIPCLIGPGLSLGTFGANDDSVLHALATLEGAGRAPEAWRAELLAEQKKRPARVAAAHASPKAGLVLPIVATVVIVLLALRWAHLAGGSA